MQHGEFSNVYSTSQLLSFFTHWGDVFQAPDKALFKLSNNTGINDFLNQVLMKFAAMYDRKDFVSWFCSEGMEEGQFVDAQENLEAFQKGNISLRNLI